MNAVLFDSWFDAVEATLSADHKGWGLSDRYERNSKSLHSHEVMIAAGLRERGFSMVRPRHYGVIGQPDWKPDGTVKDARLTDRALWYEFKSAFIPHHHSALDWHNDDYARLLRAEHPNGALGDVERLRRVPDAERVFLLLALAWCAEDRVAMLAEYVRHREVLVAAFQALTGLPAPTREVIVRGTEKPWSCRAIAWLL